jgi:hypothetical protein
MADAVRAAVLSELNNGYFTVTWTGLDSDDTGAKVTVPPCIGLTVQVLGTFNSATAVIQGSNDGTNWSNLADRAGSAIGLTAAGMAGVPDRPLYLRPTSTGGGGSTALTVILAGQRVRS